MLEKLNLFLIDIAATFAAVLGIIIILIVATVMVAMVDDGIIDY